LGEVILMKRLVVLVLSLCALVIAAPTAQTAPTSETGCTIEHVTGDECQGPDADPAANACDINTWVDNATCELTVPDGVASHASGGVFAFPELQNNNTWHAEAHLVIRDKATGTVLFTNDGSLSAPITTPPPFPPTTLGFGTTFSQQGGAEAVCEVTGTHTPAGAPGSAAAAIEGFGEFNNTLTCTVN
jgi:hypothetical protein